MAEAVVRLYSIPPADALVDEMALEMPPRRALGDLAAPIAFALARRLRKAPRAIAQELAAGLGPIDGVVRIEAAPNGYINFFLDRPKWLKEWMGDFRLKAEATKPSEGPGAAGRQAERSPLDSRGFRLQAEGQEKVIVEHTAINPNKAAHIGHLRNAALGDAFGRLLRFQG